MSKNAKSLQAVNVNQIQLNEDNPRIEISGIDVLAESIQSDGLKTPLVVVKKGKNFKILQGHRRFLAIQQIRQKNEDLLTHVDCIVHEQLTPEREISLLCDHGLVSSLTEPEKYKTVRLMLGRGMTEGEIALALGYPSASKGKGFVQTRKRLALLPEGAETIYFARFDRDEKVSKTVPFKLGSKEINALYKAMNQDGERDGPEYRKVWNQFVKQYEREGKTKVDGEMRKKKAIVQMRDLSRNEVVQSTLRWVLGEEIQLLDFDAKK